MEIIIKTIFVQIILINVTAMCLGAVTIRSHLTCGKKVLITFNPENQQWVSSNDIKLYTTINGELKNITDLGQFTQIGNGYNKTSGR